MNARSELARLRLAKGYQQRDLAALLNGSRKGRGMLPSLLSEVESGMRLPTAAQVRQLAVALDQEPVAIILAWRKTAYRRIKYQSDGLLRRWGQEAVNLTKEQP